MRYILAIIVCSVLLLSGCEKKYLRTDKYPKVERIFMHRTGDYSWMVLKGLKLESIHPDFNGVNKADVFPDVEPGAPMWVEDEIWNNGCGVEVHQVRIHVHSAKEIEGAGWNAGKGGRGQTNVIE
jgi:hypothetical protein